MVIHSLTLHNVRGLDHASLSDLPGSGVVLIGGDNETGKSTLLEAISVVLTEKYSSKKKEIRALETIGGSGDAPEISLEASIGAYRFTVTKRFVRSASCTLRLSTPSPAEYRNGEAEDRLREILDDEWDQDLFRATLMEQEAGATALAAAGIPPLERALSTDEVEVPDTALIQQVEKEYRRYFTGGGKAGGEWKSAEAKLEAATAEEATAAEAAREVDHYRAQVERAELDRDTAARALPKLRDQLDEQRERLSRARAVEQALDSARSALESAALRADAARRDVETRAELADRVAATKAEHDRLAEQAGELKTAATQHREALEAHEERASVASNRVAEAKRQYSEADRTLEHVTGSARLAELRELREDMERLSRLRREARRAARVAGVTPEDLKALEEAEVALRLARAKQDAAAPELRLAAENATTPQVSVNGKVTSLGAELAMRIAETTTVAIGEVTATITPGADQRGLAQEVTAARNRLDELLADAGCEDLEAARARAKDRAAAEQREALASEQLAALSRSGTAEDLDQEIADLTDALGNLAETAPELSQESAAAAVAEAKARLATAEREAEALASAGAALRESEAEATWRAHEARMDAAADAAERVAADLAEAESEASSDQLQEVQEAADAALAAAKDKVAAATEVVEQAEPELAAQLFEGAERELKKTEDKHYEARNKLAELAGRIEQAQGAEERWELAKAALVVAERDHRTVARRAAAAQLLRSTLNDAQREAQETYARPYSERLLALARLVYGPNVQVGLDADLNVATRVRDETAVPFSSLSGGAKEQLAMLTRFAVADLVSDEDAVPVFVDDALGSTDIQRQYRMAAVFNELGKRRQVFVLTCVPERFAQVDAAREYSMEEIRGAGR